MPRAQREIPPPLELLCLRTLWTMGEGTAKDVRQALAPSRPLAYTTVLTLLERLARKGKLTRRKTGRAFCYKPVEPRDVFRRAAIRELLESFFDGSEEELLRFLARGEEPALAAAAFEPSPAASDDLIDTVLL